MDTPKTGLRPSSRAPAVLLAAAAVAAAILAVTWLRQRTGLPPASPPEVARAVAGGAETPSGTVPVVEPDQVRSLLESVSASALFRRALAEGDLVRRWTVVTDNLAEGVSPRAQLGFLAPGRPFSVVTRGGEHVIAPESYGRYDEFADAVASVDARAVASVYRELHPVLEAAYRALGYPNASLDGVTARALHRLEAAPARDGAVVVRREGRAFLFADDRLEDLGAVEKQLLRMGPRNTRLLQAKAREILDALGLPPGAQVAGQR
ncbi:MAG TPA: DUF3014 domain-containing protein [Anaeromyxobacteraceae bacterium]